MKKSAELVLGQARAVDLRLDEAGRDVVTRVGATGLAELAAVVDQVERERARERQQADRGIGRRDVADVLLADDLGVGVPEQLVAELDQQPAIVDRQAHDLGEDPHRDLRGDVLDPVELVALERLLEDPAGEPADPLLVGVDDPRREPLVDERAQSGVGGRVGVEHRLPRLHLLRRQVLERRAPELGRVRLPVLRHLDDVVVARERPRSRGRPPPAARRAAPRGAGASASRTGRRAPRRRGR